MASQYPGDFPRHGLEAGRARLVLYSSEEAHRSIDNNAVLLGVGLENVRIRESVGRC
jgi:aromatic-L-amino-acid decarboxylase